MFCIPESLRGRPRPLFGPDGVTTAGAGSETIFRGRPRPRLGASEAGLGVEVAGYLRGRPRPLFSPVSGVASTCSNDVSPVSTIEVEKPRDATISPCIVHLPLKPMLQKLGLHLLYFGAVWKALRQTHLRSQRVQTCAWVA